MTEEKSKVHEGFMRNSIVVLCATTCYGMGIDKPDIRLVVNYGAPSTMESLFQMFGRAGRDCEPAVCLLIANCKDFTYWQHEHKKAEGSQSKQRSLEAVRRYHYTVDACRWLQLAKCLESAEDIQRLDSLKGCGSCDVCQAKIEMPDAVELRDFTQPAKVLCLALSVEDSSLSNSLKRCTCCSRDFGLAAGQLTPQLGDPNKVPESRVAREYKMLVKESARAGQGAAEKYSHQKLLGLLPHLLYAEPPLHVVDVWKLAEAGEQLIVATQPQQLMLPVPHYLRLSALGKEICQECRCHESESGIILKCDGCDRCFHPECCNVVDVPEAEWFCSLCLAPPQFQIPLLHEMSPGAAQPLAPVSSSDSDDDAGEMIMQHSNKSLLHRRRVADDDEALELRERHEALQHLERLPYEVRKTHAFHYHFALLTPVLLTRVQVRFALKAAGVDEKHLTLELLRELFSLKVVDEE
eukprot:364899-Prymnesium_polylepis.3